MGNRYNVKSDIFVILLKFPHSNIIRVFGTKHENTKTRNKTSLSTEYLSDLHSVKSFEN